MPLATFLIVTPAIRMISSLRSPARRWISFRAKSAEASALMRNTPAMITETKKHDEALPETAQRPENCHAQFRQGFPVGRNSRFQALGSQKPYFRNRFPDQGHPATDGRGRDHKGLVLNLDGQALYPFNQRSDKQAVGSRRMTRISRVNRTLPAYFCSPPSVLR